MKKVLLKKRKYTYKDIFRYIGLTLAHYVGFYLYFVLIFGIHYAVNGDLFGDIKTDAVLLFYCAIIAPGVNALVHAIYSERGIPWVRMIVWAHSFFVIFATPIVIFVS